MRPKSVINYIISTYAIFGVQNQLANEFSHVASRCNLLHNNLVIKSLLWIVVIG